MVWFPDTDRRALSTPPPLVLCVVLAQLSHPCLCVLSVGRTQVMSGYPALMVSTDDWVMTSGGIALLSTENSPLYGHVCAFESVLARIGGLLF